MDTIVLGCFMSSEKRENKAKIFKLARKACGGIDDTQRQSVVDTSLHFVLRGDKFEENEAKKLLLCVGKYSPGAILKFVESVDWNNVAAGEWRSQAVVAAGNNDISALKTNPDQICTAFDCMLRFTSENDETHIMLMTSIRGEIIRLLHNVWDPARCVVICNFIKSHNDCVDSGRAYPVCSLILQNISHFSLGQNQDDSTEFIRNVHQIVDVVGFLWAQQNAIIIPFLKELFMLISSRDTEPSFALAAIVQIIPEAMVDNMVRELVTTSEVSDADMVTALRRMVNWLCWPTARMVPRWIVAFLCAFSTACKFSVLIDVIYGNVKSVCECLKYPMTRDSALSVLVHMLLCYQHSPDAFHLVVPMFPELIARIKAEDASDAQKLYLTQLSNLCHCLMFHFSGFPELYDPLLKAIEEFPKPSEKEITAALQQASTDWYGSSLQSNAQSGHTFVSDVTSLQPRSLTTGRVGLSNLGNTCYANCVIQALFYSDCFRTLVGTTARSFHRNSVHRTMELTFAFLKLSDRQAYKPEKLIEASRPSWFEKGMQQDSSEYLKFMVDKLQEEEIETKSESDKKLSANRSSQTDLVVCDGPGSSSVYRNHEGPSAAASHVVISNSSIAGLKANLVAADRYVETPSNLFTGQQTIEIECHRCQRKSTNTEPFVDISLPLVNDPSVAKEAAGGLKAGALPQSGPFPKIGPSIVMQETGEPMETSEVKDASSLQNSPATKHQFSALLSTYLQPEILDGDNLYQCHACDSLQKATKIISFSKLPKHLLFTLMRFTYDREKKCRTKILDTVDIERHIEVEAVDEHGMRQRVRYSLWAVVIHSGSSAESGHYYCYAIPAERASNEGNEDWYLLNDSHVSLTNFENIQNLSTAFPRDTAYMLMYNRVDEGVNTANTSDNVRPEIKHIVQADNQAFLNERESEAKRKATEEKQRSFNAFGGKWDKEEDEDRGPGPCGSSNGGGIDLTGSRLIF